MEQLTKRQTQILRMIDKFIETEGFPPTRAEIAAKLGFRSPNAAEDHLRALQRKGAIELLPGASRGIRLREAKRVGLPVVGVGRLAAGSPILADENIEAYYNVDGRLFEPRANYFFRLKGMSMRDAGLLNGDLLAVHTTREAVSGQIVVARVENEVTVRRFRRRGAKVRLLPENPTFSPIEVDLRQQSFTIEGLAVGVLRNNPFK